MNDPCSSVNNLNYASFSIFIAYYLAITIRPIGRTVTCIRRVKSESWEFMGLKHTAEDDPVHREHSVVCIFYQESNKACALCPRDITVHFISVPSEGLPISYCNLYRGCKKQSRERVWYSTSAFYSMQLFAFDFILSCSHCTVHRLIQENVRVGWSERHSS